MKAERKKSKENKISDYSCICGIFLLPRMHEFPRIKEGFTLKKQLKSKKPSGSEKDPKGLLD
jgi:hypothetical protein